MKVNHSQNTQCWQKISWYKNSTNATIVEVSNIPMMHDWQEAYKQTINNITKYYPPPYYLCLTGGIDSQSMLYAWYQTLGCHPDVIPVSFMYNEDCNAYDHVGLDEICSNYGYQRQIKKFDLMAFIDSGECKSYQIKHFTQSPQMAAWIKMVESLGSGTVIMSGELTYNKTYTSMVANHLGVREYAQNLNLSDSDLKYIPFFFEHDQSIATAHWNILKHVKYQIPNLENYDLLTELKNIYTHKKVVKYQTVGYPVIPQTLGLHGRCSGFEKFKEIYEQNHNYDREVCFKNIRPRSETSNRMFDVNLRLNLCDTIKYSHDIITNVI